jgi:hypothetical protein
MGWTNTHLYQFEFDGGCWGAPEWVEPGLMDASQMAVGRLLRGAGAWMDYTYNFGDNWQHRIVLEKVRPDSLVWPMVACLGGRRACPPEDVGGSFDPGAFDPVATNDALEALFKAKRRRTAPGR